MLRLSLTLSTALVAVSLAIVAPIPVFAQDTPAVTRDHALIWTSVERFGVLLPVPEGAPVTDDIDTPTDRSFAINTTDDSSSGVRIGIKVLTPADLAELPAAPGAEGFAAFLSQVGGVEVAQTGVVVQLGQRALHAYGGSGTRTAPNGVQIDARMLFLVAHDLDAEGEGLMLAFYAQGMEAQAAGLAEAEFVTRLAAAPVPVASPVPRVEVPATVDPQPAESFAGAAPPMILIDGLAMLALTPDDVIVRTERSETGVDLRLTNAQGQLLRVIAGPPDVALADRLRRFVGPRGSVDQAELGGQPVWLVQAFTQRPPIGRRTDGPFPITLVIPQYCLAGGEGLAVAVISEAGAGVEALLQGLTFTRPQGADMCATLAALPEALLYPPAALEPGPTPAPLLPVAEAPPAAEVSPATTDAAVQDGKLPARADAPEVLAAPQPPSAPFQPPVATPLSVVPEVPGLRDELALWADAVSRNRPEGFWTYLKAYPYGQFAQLAQVMLANAHPPAIPAPMPPPDPPQPFK